MTGRPSNGRSPDEPAIVVHEVRKVYLPPPRWSRVFLRAQVTEPVEALAGVSLTFPKRAFTMVAGANGAGKTTLFRIITSLVSPTSGSVSLLGIDVEQHPEQVRSRLGFMAGDDRSLWLRHTCEENLDFHARLQGLNAAERRRRITECLELVGLSEKRNASCFALSGGMRARLQLARALLHSPPVLILDEPTGPIDPVGAFELLTAVRSIVDELGLAVVMSTHRVDEIEMLPDNVVLLHKGHVVHAGRLGDLASRVSNAVAITFADEASAADAAAFLITEGRVQVLGQSDCVVTIGTETAAGPALASLGPRLERVRTVTEALPPLREVLVDVLGDDSEGDGIVH